MGSKVAFWNVTLNVTNKNIFVAVLSLNEIQTGHGLSPYCDLQLWFITTKCAIHGGTLWQYTRSRSYPLSPCYFSDKSGEAGRVLVQVPWLLETMVFINIYLSLPWDTWVVCCISSSQARSIKANYHNWFSLSIFSLTDTCTIISMSKVRKLYIF